MTTTAAQRTAAHAAFIARAAFIVELCFKHGSTDGGASFPTDAHTAAFYADIEAYDTASVKPEPIAAQVSATIDLGPDLPAPFEGVTTRRMAVATLCDDIEHAEGLTAANQVVLDTLVIEGRAEPHHHARLAFDNAAIDIMYQQHATLLGRSLDDRA